MIVNGRGRGLARLGLVTGALTAVVLAAGAVGLPVKNGAAAASKPPAATSRPAATSAPAASAVPAATVGTKAAATAARLPWPVGPGWELAEYTTGPAWPRSANYPVTLYLISPAGNRYSLHTWPAHTTAPYLIAWSGDKTRALLGLSGSKYEQFTLATGKLTSGHLAGTAEPVGYTLPDGLNILGVTEGSTGTSPSTVARYSLTGQLLKVLTRGMDEGAAVYSSNGTELAVSGSKGLELVSNAGGVIRALPLPGTAGPNGCTPARWWNGSTVLAECYVKNAIGPQLWLVPANGGRPTALSRPRTAANANAGDLGDFDAWQLSSGTYLQGATGCGTVGIFKQAASGSITLVRPAHTEAVDDRIVTALNGRFLIDAQTGCPGSQSLLWYNPATQAEQWLLHTPSNEVGVIGVVAYNSPQNAPQP